MEDTTKVTNERKEKITVKWLIPIRNKEITGELGSGETKLFPIEVGTAELTIDNDKCIYVPTASTKVIAIKSDGVYYDGKILPCKVNRGGGTGWIWAILIVIALLIG